MVIDSPHSRIENQVRRTNPALATVLIEQHGETVYSKVFDPAVSLHTPWQVRSVTKSVTSALVGIAIEQGYIRDVHQSVASLLPSYNELYVASPGVGQISLHQLLSMTTGIPWKNGAFGNEPAIGRVLRQTAWVEFILRLPTYPALAGQFQYNSAVSHLLSAILSETTGLAADVFAQEALFNPLGIVDYAWEHDPQGVAIGGWGLSLTPVDMAKIGQLYLSCGLWQNRQLIPASWIEQSTTAHSPGCESGYGYQWWLMELNGLHTWCAVGLGGQCICCVPEHDAVIVTTSKPVGKRKPLWPLIEKYFLPMIA